MMFKKYLLRKIRNLSKRIYKKRSLVLAALLFILSGISPVVGAKVSSPTSPTSIVQSPYDAEQLANKATKFYQSGRFAEAASAWKQTASVFAARKDRLNQAMALSNLSLSYQQLGQWEQAKKAIEDSLALLKTPLQGKQELKVLAQSLEIQGSLQRELGQTTDALNSWQEATKIYARANDPDKLAQSKINQAQAMQDLGLYPRACSTLLEVFNQELGVKSCDQLGKLTQDDLTKKLQDIELQRPSLYKVVGLRSLGELQRFIGQLKQSQMILEASLNQAKKLNDPQEQAAVYLSLGNTARDLGEVDVDEVRRTREESQRKALFSYSEVVKLSPSPTARQQAQLNQLSLWLSQLKPKKSLESQESENLPQSDIQDVLSQAEQLWETLNPQLRNLSASRTGVYLQINFAQNFIELLAQQKQFVLQANSKLPTFNDIDRILVKAAEQARTLADKRAEAYALGNRGRLYELSGSTQNLPKAEELTKQALSLASSFSTPDIAYQYFWQLGRIRRDQGDIKDAIAAYTKAYYALQSLRSELVAINPEVQFSFRNNVEPVYRELVELDLRYVDSLKQAGTKEADSLKQTEKQNKPEGYIDQARTVIESLQLAELNNFFRESCVEAKAQKIDDIDKTAAVIYTIALEDRLDVILSVPDQLLTLHTNRLRPGELKQVVDKVQRSLVSFDSQVKDYLPEYQQLYNWIIQPLEAELAKSKVKTLAFVLDKDLRNIPMGILNDGKQYLLEKYAVAVTPGLQLVNPKPISKVGLRALTAGLSKNPPNETFRELSNVKTELEQIEKFGVSSKELLNEKFTTDEIKKQTAASRVPPIVHLATHGQFSSDVDKTFILAWDRRINVKELGGLLRDNTQYQRTPIELLVLSACQTASGDDRAALGLAGVAVRSGARSTLATLWSVEDKSTAQVMGEFYRQLKTKANKAQALQQAQLALKNQLELKNPDYAHPHFWAPFVLVGNWQ